MNVLAFPTGEKVPPQPVDEPEIEFAGMKFRSKLGSSDEWEFWDPHGKAEWKSTDFLTIEGFQIDILLNLIKTAKPVVQAAYQIHGMFRHNPKMRHLHAVMDQFVEAWRELDHDWLLIEEQS